MSALKIPLIDFALKDLLIIAKVVSKIGIPKTMIGAIKTIAVYVFAVPTIEIIASENPKKLEPVSPIKVFAG